MSSTHSQRISGFPNAGMVRMEFVTYEPRHEISNNVTF